PMGEWSRSRKMTARVQAHGAMGDVMRGYGLSDIPEGEEGTDADQYSVIIDHRRLASSAGHIYQKPVISCESYTWLRVPLFTVTLEMMKGATDSSFLDGINQIVNQGYSYSPPGVGWVFYASTMVNHNNIWWRHYKYLAGYIQRTAALLLQGVSVNPIAVYVPLADIYAHYGLGSLVIDHEIDARLGPELFQDLRRAGYDFDLINDDALARIATVQDGTLRAGTAAYSAVIVPGVEHMPPESLRRLAEFARSGGLLIFMERLPGSAPGVKDQESRTAHLRQILHSIWVNGQSAINSSQNAGKGKAVLAADRAAALKAIEAELTPDFKIVAAGDSSNKARQSAVENVGFAHRKDGNADFYFLSNISHDPQDLRVQFDVGHRVPQRWNPEAHSIEETLVFDYVDLPKAKVTEVQIHLDPMDSCFVAFGAARESPLLTGTDCAGPLRVEKVGKRTRVTGFAPQSGRYFVRDGKGKTHRFAVKQMPEIVAVKGPWKLTLGGQPAVTLNDLQSWGELPQGKTYSGWGTYEATFEVEELQDGVEWLIDLGSVHETAEVFLNGVDLGAAWKGLRRLPCGDALRKGSNHLKVEVGNLWIQRAQSLVKSDFKAVAETFGIRWGTYGEKKLRRLPPSGLLGPVRLLPRKRFSLAI
ncbi:MAG TPA: glycosyl hydrolase, partial [Terriglobia bacterium]|nr:glycosyl hydrolase [Terriglobia bacterium]